MSLINIIIILLGFEMIIIVHANPVPSKINSKPFKPNENATVAKGSTVVLQCYFNSNVNCAWVRSGILLIIGQRYNYQEGNGENTKDCSLLIENLSEIDIGEWRCENLGDDSTSSVRRSLVHVAMQNSIDINTGTRPTESSYRTSHTMENYALQKDTSYRLNIIIVMTAIVIVLFVVLIAVILYLIFYSRVSKETPNKYKSVEAVTTSPDNERQGSDTSSNEKLIHVQS